MKEKFKQANFELESVKLAGSLILGIHFANKQKTSKTSFDFVFNIDQTAHVSSGCMIFKKVVGALNTKNQVICLQRNYRDTLGWEWMKPKIQELMEMV